MRRGGRYSAGVGKRDGIPTGFPVPQAIDDYSGFKVPLSHVRKDWQGLYSVSPDKRNPQDFVRGVRDNPALPFSRPETANTYVAVNIVWQDGLTYMSGEAGQPLLTQGVDPADTL